MDRRGGLQLSALAFFLPPSTNGGAVSPSGGAVSPREAMAEGRLLLLAAILLYFFGLNWVWIVLAHPLGRMNDLPIVATNVIVSGSLLLMLRRGFSATTIITLWAFFVLSTACWACVCRPILGLDKWLLIIPMQVFFVLGSRAGSLALSASIALHVLLHANLKYMMELMSCEPFVNDLFFEAEGRLWANLCFATYVGLSCVGYECARTHAEDALLEALHEKDCINARLREADKAKERFLANTSHELRTPLHGILAMIHELREDTRIASNAKLCEALGIISDCADHLYSLITDILDFEMLMRDQPALNVSSLSITDEVLQVYNVLAPQAKEKKIAFDKEIDVKHNARIGDARRLRQVLYNLAANALKFTPEGGTVRISVHDSAHEGKNSEDSGLGDKSDDNDDDLVVLQVSDTGIGIADSLMPNLFMGFSQGDASLRRKYGGNGLGLAISKRLVEAMHGDIECSSRLGCGSTFTASVRLPRDDDQTKKLTAVAPRALVEWPREGTAALASPRSAPHAAISSQPEEHKESEDKKQEAKELGEQQHQEGPRDPLEGKRILLAEDNIVNQKVGVRMLRALGCQPVVAVNGAEALSAMKRHYDDLGATDPKDHIDLVLMDCQMPIMDGFTATEEIRKLEEHTCSEKPAEADTGSPSGGDPPPRAALAADTPSYRRSQGGRSRLHVPIVALTASATPDYQQKCYTHGMDDFLSKPLSKATLADTLRRWIAAG